MSLLRISCHWISDGTYLCLDTGGAFDKHYLRIWGIFVPDKLTEELRVSPTFVRRRGERPTPPARPVEEDPWVLELPLVKTTDMGAPAEQLARLLDQVEPIAEKLRAFLATHMASARMLVTSYVGDDDRSFIPVVELDPGLVSRVAAVGIRVEFGRDRVSAD